MREAKALSLALAFSLLGPVAIWLPNAAALDELFELYAPPQVVCMGGAVTADATGYLANYYNPAGLAKTSRRKADLTFVDVVGNFGGGGIGALWDAQSFGVQKVLDVASQSAGDYNYFSYSSMPGYAARNFAITFLFNQRYAGLSDGTNLDVDYVLDLGPSIGFGYSFFGGVVKVGASAKFLLRNELKGTFAHSALNGDTMEALSKEGFGIGADVGLIMTLPYKMFPTFGMVLRDVTGTKFTATNILYSQASGAPDPIPQSLNAAVSIRPRLGKRFVATISAEVKHILRSEIPFSQRFHFGIQLEDEKSFYLWLGMNQFNPTGGFGLRLPGGALEIGTYAQDTSISDAPTADRRFMFRYTIGF